MCTGTHVLLLCLFNSLVSIAASYLPMLGSALLAIAVMSRRLAAIAAAAAAAPGASSKPTKKPPAPSSTLISYEPVRQQQLPADGLAVLKLQLTPAAALRQAPAAECTQQQHTGAAAAATMAVLQEVSQPPAAAVAASTQQPPSQALEYGVRLVGSRKSAVQFWQMDPVVSLWTDVDSLAAWASQGAVLQQDPQQKQQAQPRSRLLGSKAGRDAAIDVDGQAGQPGCSAADELSAASTAAGGTGAGGSEGLGFTVDGKPVESFEAFMQHLLTTAQQQQASQQQ